MKFKMKKNYKESYKVNWLEKGNVYDDSQLLGGLEKAKSLVESGYAVTVPNFTKTAPLQANPELVKEAKEIKEALAKRPDILNELLDEVTAPEADKPRRGRPKADG